KINADYLLMKATNDTKIDSVDAGIGRIKNTIQREEALFESYLNDGFLTRIEALENLLKSNPALQARYYLIVFILLLIELMPVIAKSAVPAGTYEAKVEEQEEMEAELANLEYEKEKELRKLMIVESKDSDGEMVKTFFKEMAPLRKQRMQE